MNKIRASFALSNKKYTVWEWKVSFLITKIISTLLAVGDKAFIYEIMKYWMDNFDLINK